MLLFSLSLCLWRVAYTVRLSCFSRRPLRLIIQDLIILWTHTSYASSVNETRCKKFLWQRLKSTLIAMVVSSGSDPHIPSSKFGVSLQWEVMSSLRLPMLSLLEDRVFYRCSLGTAQLCECLLGSSCRSWLLQMSRALLGVCLKFLKWASVAVRLLFRSVSSFLFHSRRHTVYQISGHSSSPVSQIVDHWVSDHAAGVSLHSPLSALSLFLSVYILKVNYFKSFWNGISHLLSHRQCQAAPAKRRGLFLDSPATNAAAALGLAVLLVAWGILCFSGSCFSALLRLFSGDTG